MAAKIKKGDTVVVLTGRDKGKSGEVVRVMPKETRALVRGINLVKRHQRQTAQQEGGIVNKEAPIQLSNLAIRDPKDGRPTRVGFKVLDDGRHGVLRIYLKYHEDRPVIRGIERLSRPGRRRYAGVAELPRIRNGLGMAIVSTSRGVMTDREARETNVGGEVLAAIW